MIEITSFMGALLVPRLFQPIAGQHWSSARLSADLSLKAGLQEACRIGPHRESSGNSTESWYWDTTMAIFAAAKRSKFMQKRRFA
jgi:hypothetical protein